MKELTDIYEKLKAEGLLGDEPHYFAVKSPLNSDEGWVIELIWVHHDGDIKVGVSTGQTLEDAIGQFVDDLNEFFGHRRSL